MIETKLVYICEDIGSVFDSQVIALLSGIAERNFFKDIYLLLGIKNDKQINDFLTKYENLNFKIKFFYSYPNYPFFNLFLEIVLKNLLKKENLLNECFIFHCRGERLPYFILRIARKKNLNLKIIADLRGASIEEVKEFYGKNSILKYFKVLNYHKFLSNIKDLKYVSVVSESLRKYMIDKFDFKNDSLYINPCLADKNFIYHPDAKEKVRRELNIPYDETLFVFSSGGVAMWQNIGIIELIADKGFKVLNLSKKKIEHKNIINKFVKFSEMPFYLSAADIGVIWRAKSIVNEVSSPVKFSEYLSCGLPIISNNAVGVINYFIQKYKIGVIIDSLEFIDESVVGYLKGIDRKYIAEIGKNNFSLDVILNGYFKLYSCYSI